jgi:hypothetical protein
MKAVAECQVVVVEKARDGKADCFPGEVDKLLQELICKLLRKLTL